MAKALGNYSILYINRIHISKIFTHIKYIEKPHQQPCFRSEKFCVLLKSNSDFCNQSYAICTQATTQFPAKSFAWQANIHLKKHYYLKVHLQRVYDLPAFFLFELVSPIKFFHCAIKSMILRVTRFQITQKKVFSLF